MKKSKFAKAILGIVLGLAVFAGAASANAYSFTAYLKPGVRNADVKEMQKLLNSMADTMVGTTGAGSPGYETTYYGSKTVAALKKFQAKYNLAVDGLVGPKTRAQLNAVSSGSPSTPSTPVSQTGPVMAALASSNPASGTIIASQATADLMHINFTGNGVVNSVTLTRGGISDQNTLSNIYLYDGVTRLTDGYSFNTNGSLTINNLNLMVNGSKVISVKADVSSSTQSYSISVALTSFSAGASVNTVNLKGNEMYIATSQSLATMTLSGSNTVSAASVNAGTSSYRVWGQAVQVSTRALMLKAANFRITGSAPSDALSNVGFYVDGIKAGNNAAMVMVNGSNYLSFDMSAMPLSLSTGSHTFEVRADIVKGSSYNFTVALQQASDLMVMDPQVGVNIAISSFSASTAGVISIGTGSFTAVVDPSFSALTTTTAGASNVAIAKFKIRGYGEDVKVTSLPVYVLVGTQATATSNAAGTTATVVSGGSGYVTAPTVTVSGGTCTTLPSAVATLTSGAVSSIALSGAVGCTVAPTLTVAGPTNAGLQNVSLYFNGSQIGSQQTLAQGASNLLTFSLGSQMIVAAGVDSVLEVRADLRNAAGTNYSSGSVSANIGAATAEGFNSKASITGPAVAGNVLTMQSGTLALSANAGYASQNANPNTNVKIGSFVLQNQSSSEAIRITTLAVKLAYGAGTSSANLSGLKTSETSGNAGTPVQPATAAASSNATNTFSSDFTIAPGAIKTIDIFADSSSDAGATATVQSSLTVTSIGAVSNVSATSSLTAGQTITFRTGTLGTPTISTAPSTTAQLIAAANGGSADGSRAVYNFTSANAGSTITELTFTATNATYVKIGSLSAPVVGGTAYLTGLNIAVPNGGSGVNQDVFVSYPEVGTSGVASASSSVLTLTTIKSTSGNTTTTSTVSVAAPTMTLVGSMPAYTIAGSTDTLANGSVKIAEITISANAKGDIKLGQLPITVTSTGVASIASASDNIVVKDTSGATIATTNATFAVAAGGSGSANICFDTAVAACASGQAVANGYLITAGQSKTFRIYVTAATVSGAVNTTSLSTKLGTASSATYYDVAGGASSAQAGTLIYNYPTDSVSIHN